MKYIISENKLDDIFKRFMDITFDVNEINYLYLDKYDFITGETHDETEDAIEFYFGDYSEDETFGRRYESDYFETECPRCPFFSLENTPWRIINSTFGEVDVWGKYFVKWFNESFPEYPIKNVE